MKVEGTEEEVTMEIIDSILRHHYCTGIYGHTHFLVSAEVLDVMSSEWREKQPPTYEFDFGARTMSIPVILDTTLAPGHWRLVNTSTKDVIHAGKLSLEVENLEPRKWRFYVLTALSIVAMVAGVVLLAWAIKTGLLIVSR